MIMLICARNEVHIAETDTSRMGLDSFQMAVPPDYKYPSPFLRVDRERPLPYLFTQTLHNLKGRWRLYLRPYREGWFYSDVAVVC